MTKEPFLYRARKWALQQITSPSTQQLDRIRTTDWDALLILDACRYDMFKELVSVPVEPVTSHASATPQWIRTMSDAGEFDDVTVITGNPQYSKVDRSIPRTKRVIDRILACYWLEARNFDRRNVVAQPAVSIEGAANHQVSIRPQKCD